MITEENTRSSWHLDKNLPVALLAAIGLQTAVAIWWAASVSANVAAIQGRVDKLETNTTLTIVQGNQLAAVDVKVSSLQDSLREVKGLVMSLMNPPKDRAAR